jgi:hypothetical protein
VVTGASSWWRWVGIIIFHDRAIGLLKSLAEAVCKSGAATRLHSDIVSFLTSTTSLVGLVSPASLLVGGVHRVLATRFGDIAVGAVSFDHSVH